MTSNAEPSSLLWKQGDVRIDRDGPGAYLLLCWSSFESWDEEEIETLVLEVDPLMHDRLGSLVKRSLRWLDTYTRKA